MSGKDLVCPSGLDPAVWDALTPLQRDYVTLRVQGLTPRQAKRAALPSSVGEKELMEQYEEHPTVQMAIRQINRASMLRVAITREFIAQGLLDAHMVASTATEQIAALRELAKLYGLYEPEKHEVNVNQVSRERLAALSDEELARLAGGDLAKALEAEFEVVDDESGETNKE